ncbi:aminotransferase-like domain-containing protein [Mobiluncus mulieris]|uniref:aminotransferase-like domain-containing protein n=1 Tax=Mobiluncus mulieris TaxID=2052 RepID=UPI00019F8DF1|nr:PLP-dependent aminotransferase family protein [Mobiluncus mulieris]EEJ53266.1 aminotransferase, class I/II [Mobiluncus mulieris ATCC 35243]MCV0002384.1 PLP-dependent aminotransferase family protein [Mobiluncus mulieris]SPX70465.1 2-aminoadipate transaminase [Mobiluncus mulieris]
MDSNTHSHIDWAPAFSARAQNLKISQTRALFAVASRPEVVSLAGGMPNLKDLPLHDIARSFGTLFDQNGATAMQYGGGQGYEALREQITDIMSLEGISASAANVTITCGSQHALDLVTQLFVDPGEPILVEAPSYVGALSVFHSYQCDVHHVLMDDDGLIPEALEEAATALEAAGRPAKFLYTVPNFHNPGGMTLAETRRPQIVEICARHGILILEDNPYGLLGFDGHLFPALQPLNPEGIIYLGSFSKMFAPGFRIGWVLAPKQITEKLVVANETAILCPPMAAQMTISTYLRDFDWYGQVDKFRVMYRGRARAALEALAKFLPDCTWTQPKGGFYTWVHFPSGINTWDMLPRAVHNLVAYVSGSAFYTDGRGTDYLRIAYCYPPEEEIREGIRRLAVTVAQEKELNGAK